MKRTPSCMSLARPDTRVSLSSVWQLLMMLMWHPSARRSRVASWNRSCTKTLQLKKCCLSGTLHAWKQGDALHLAWWPSHAQRVRLLYKDNIASCEQHADSSAGLSV